MGTQEYIKHLMQAEEGIALDIGEDSKFNCGGSKFKVQYL